MYALSVQQPWAWAILHAGKSVENRTWWTGHRGPLVIHAAKSRASYNRQDVGAWYRLHGQTLPDWEDLTKGALLGIVEVVDCVRVADAPRSLWVEGPWCWVLANPRPFAKPILYPGSQNLFHVSEWLVSSGSSGPAAVQIVGSDE